MSARITQPFDLIIPKKTTAEDSSKSERLNQIAKLPHRSVGQIIEVLRKTKDQAKPNPDEKSR